MLEKSNSVQDRGGVIGEVHPVDILGDEFPEPSIQQRTKMAQGFSAREAGLERNNTTGC